MRSSAVLPVWARPGLAAGPVLALFLLAGCDAGGPASLISAETPSAEIVDGAHGGSYGGFLFLPPMVANPDLSGQTPIGGLAPRVEVCVVDMSAQPWECDGASVLTFGPAQIAYVSDHYQVDWDTQNPFPVEPTSTGDTTTYRLTVFLGSVALGHVDLQFGSNGGSAKNLSTSDVVGLKDGRTMPVKFFLGTELYDDICGDGNDCKLATAYPGQDNLIVTRDGDALLYIPEGALPPGGPYHVTIEEKACTLNFPADLPQGSYLPEYNSCYEYTIDEDPTLLAPLTVGQCRADTTEIPAGHEDEVQLGAHHTDPPAGVPEYELLPNTDLPAALSCDDYTPPGTQISFLRRGIRGVRDFFLGEPAYAGHLGLGGSVRDLSTIKWVDPGLRVAGYTTARGGFVGVRSVALADAMSVLVGQYGYVWRDTASTLSSSLFDPDVDVALLGTGASNGSTISALSSAEQSALHDFVANGGCAILLPDNDTFGGTGTDAVNESLIDPFGLDITGTLNNQRTATTSGNLAVVSGVPSFLQNYPGWFDGTGAGTPFASNDGGVAALEIEPGVIGTGSGPVFAFSDVNQFFGGNAAGLIGNLSNQKLLLNSVAACGTEPAPPPPRRSIDDWPRTGPGVVAPGPPRSEKGEAPVRLPGTLRRGAATGIRRGVLPDL